MISCYSSRAINYRNGPRKGLSTKKKTQQEMAFIKIFSLNFSGLFTSCWNKSLYWAALKDENILASIAIRNNSTHVYDLGKSQHNSTAEVTGNILKYHTRFRSQMPTDLYSQFLTLWPSAIRLYSYSRPYILLWWFISNHHLRKISISHSQNNT